MEIESFALSQFFHSQLFECCLFSSRQQDCVFFSGNRSSSRTATWRLAIIITAAIGYSHCSGGFEQEMPMLDFHIDFSWLWSSALFTLSFSLWNYLEACIIFRGRANMRKRASHFSTCHKTTSSSTSSPGRTRFSNTSGLDIIGTAPWNPASHLKCM